MVKDLSYHPSDHILSEIQSTTLPNKSDFRLKRNIFLNLNYSLKSEMIRLVYEDYLTLSGIHRLITI